MKKSSTGKQKLSVYTEFLRGMFELAFVFSSTHAGCIKSVANILLIVDIPVLLYYRLLYAATLFQLLVTLKNYFSNTYAIRICRIGRDIVYT